MLMLRLAPLRPRAAEHVTKTIFGVRHLDQQVAARQENPRCDIKLVERFLGMFEVMMHTHYVVSASQLIGQCDEAALIAVPDPAATLCLFYACALIQPVEDRIRPGSRRGLTEMAVPGAYIQPCPGNGERFEHLGSTEVNRLLYPKSPLGSLLTQAIVEVTVVESQTCRAQAGILKN